MKSIHLTIVLRELFRVVRVQYKSIIMSTPISYDTVTEAIQDLVERGYTLDFDVVTEEDCLICHRANKQLSPQDFEIDEVYRFEGDSDPGDAMIVIAISAPAYNIKGYLVNAFGVYADPASSKIVSKLRTSPSPTT